MIPKIIHYCWFGPNKMPKTICKCIATWHDHMPDYEFRLWNEDNSPMEHPFVKTAYAAKKYAFVSDYVRFWALYNYGGIYLDTDMYVVRSFNPLLDNNFFCGWETAEGTATGGSNAFIGACALGACALGACARDILAKYDTLLFDADCLDQFIVPRIITPILLQHKDEITIYPYDRFYAFPFQERGKNTFLRYVTSNTYALHLWEVTWLPWYHNFSRSIRAFLSQIKKNLCTKQYCI